MIASEAADIAKDYWHLSLVDRYLKTAVYPKIEEYAREGQGKLIIWFDSRMRWDGDLKTPRGPNAIDLVTERLRQNGYIVSVIAGGFFSMTSELHISWTHS